MFGRLLGRRKSGHAEADAKIAALEKEIAELKELVKTMSRNAEQPAAERVAAPEKPVPQRSAEGVRSPSAPPEKAVCFDMVQYFCSGHDDTAVDVVQYDRNNRVVAKKIFSWSHGCGEVMPEMIWRRAEEYAQTLIEGGIPCRMKMKL